MKINIFAHIAPPEYIEISHHRLDENEYAKDRIKYYFPDTKQLIQSYYLDLEYTNIYWREISAEKTRYTIFIVFHGGGYIALEYDDEDKMRENFSRLILGIGRGLNDRKTKS